MRRLIEQVWYGRSVSAHFARAILRPASWAFRAAALLRVRLYEGGWFRSEKIEATPVVSVGNLRVGGSGKTPLVIRLVEMFRNYGLRPVVVSRGYGSSVTGPCLITPAGADSPWRGNPVPTVRVVDAATASRRPGNEGLADEALLVALRTGVPVVTNADRVAGARLASRELGADVIVLDDGFQHVRLVRDFDLLIVSADEARAICLPAGPLREPWTARVRADFVVLTRPELGNLGDPGGALEPGCAGTVRFVPTALVDSVDSVRGRSPAWLAGKKLIAVAGIARPQRFVRLVEQAGGQIVTGLYHPDHHHYGQFDISTIRRAVADADADAVVTTEKDLVKLAPMWTEDISLVALRIDARIDGDQGLLAALGECHPRLDALGRESHHRCSAPDRGTERSSDT